MSLFRWSDYRDTKKATVYAKKTKIDTASKTTVHRCSHCQSKQALKRKISEREVRWLCDMCWLKFMTKEAVERPNFIKASNLYREE